MAELWNSIYYNTFMVSTLEFISQLADVPTHVDVTELAALRKLAPGPGTWISREDLEHLHMFGIGPGFRTIGHTAKAAKRRLMRDLGFAEVKKQAERIQFEQLDSIWRPFGNWHNQSYAKRLCDNHRYLLSLGINISPKTEDFQKAAQDAIAHKLGPYNMENRIRCKIDRWRFLDPPGHVAARLCKRFRILQKGASPAVTANFLRALWNGAPTSRRMRSMPDFVHRNCVFDCTKRAEDSLEHYCKCPILKEALLGIRGSECVATRPDCMDTFFGIEKGLSHDDIILRARLVYTRMRLVHRARANPHENLDWRFIAALEFNQSSNKKYR
jgi:hypothetical protein